MLNFLIKYASHSLPYLLQLKTSLKLSFYLFAKILLNAFTQIKTIDLFEQRESNFVNTTNNTNSHSLDNESCT